MPRHPRQRRSHPASETWESHSQPPGWWRLRAFLLFLAFDAVSSLLLLTRLIHRLRVLEDLTTDHYTLHGTLSDLAILSIPRIASAVYAILFSYSRADPPESPFELYHKNGDKKSKTELEEEAMEEPMGPKLRRFVNRPSFACEFFAFLTGILLLTKCLARLNVEIGILNDSQPEHPLFWIALTVNAFCAFVETIYLESIEAIAGALGQFRQQSLLEQGGTASWIERMGQNLTRPLLSNGDVDDEHANGDVENSRAVNDDRVRSDITGDANYKANWSDLLSICAADKYLILAASFFLVAAALANVYIPRLTGNILDALLGHSSDSDPDSSTFHSDSVLNIPGFVSNIEKLLLVSILGGIFGGIRGAIFSLVGARVNVRLRIKLMDSVMTQDISFFEITRTGDLTSRLSSDTTLVGSQVTSNVNTFLRSIVSAMGVLFFMFLISWQLSLLAFITIPVVSVLSKWYGRFIRRLSKFQQKKLAQGNAVSESAISAMPTVRAFGAETAEMLEFQICMENYLVLNARAAFATFGYYACVGALPRVVEALVLYYGGLLVRSQGPNRITGGQLVSFILYLSSLSDAFSSLGGIFASLTRAVGAADKVFELMHRKPQLTVPSHLDPERMNAMEKPGMLGIDAMRTAEQRVRGLHPATCIGEVTLKNVVMRYPSRPQRVVLHDMNLTIPPGSIVALVGSSGSGKSSVISLITHLYEPASGEICIDGTKVHELSPEWLYRHVSVVSQEPTLFARSVRRNIIYGLEGTEYEPTQQEIEDAARLANAASFIELLPFGYDTDIGERGVQLSGGQKQRVAIARALVRKPRILLLDEATSALDAESEALVQEAIDGMISGQRSLDGDAARSMTVIIVAHRLSTVRNADVIFVVDNGRIIEHGNHDELIEKENGAYAALVSRQINAQNKLGTSGSQVSLNGNGKH